eukprot:CAMPEP_0194172002 /NCGR_PEP_ID=MMETSP0154-20130528/6542_1 /TAXON_ID=1049557 /ORGANISM="Thalassiothrix antarctica, Strain L6-D1" /LENGTH=145 /DNA_ID=CAMNT_0038884535 /DNA_START=701 /DNA_END=1138 /DNA_ORIENTATION=-
MTLATVSDINVEIVAPAAPNPEWKIKNGSNTNLMALDAIQTYNGVFVSSVPRNAAKLVAVIIDGIKLKARSRKYGIATSNAGASDANTNCNIHIGLSVNTNIPTNPIMLQSESVSLTLALTSSCLPAPDRDATIGDSIVGRKDNK